jgi:hypothetical protein
LLPGRHFHGSLSGKVSHQVNKIFPTFDTHEDFPLPGISPVVHGKPCILTGDAFAEKE